MAPLKVPPPCGKGNLGLKPPGGGSWGNLKCLGRMIRSLYNKNQDPELDCCVGELYRMSMVCFLRTTFTPPGRFSVSPFLKDNCTSDFPN